MKADRLIKISLILILVYATVAFWVMYFELQGSTASKLAERELAAVHEELASEETIGTDDAFAQELLSRNPDSAGWLTIPGTPVDYPVLLTTDNETYLKQDYLGQSSSLGALFFDYECRIDDLEGKNLIIYGHTTKSDQIFGSLKHYREEGYFLEHDVISLYRIGEGERQFQVFSVFLTPAYPEAATNYMDYRQIYFASEGEYKDWLAYFQSQSLFATEVQPDPTKQVLTLSTCAYDFADARLVVMALEIES